MRYRKRQGGPGNAARSLDLGRPELGDTKPAAAGTEEVSGSRGGQDNGVSGAEGPRSRRGSRVLGQLG